MYFASFCVNIPIFTIILLQVYRNSIRHKFNTRLISKFIPEVNITKKK